VWLVPGMFVLLAVGLLSLDTSVRWDTVKKISAATLSPTASGTLPIPVGTREEMLSLPSSSMDARWWILYAEDMIREGSARIRSTQLDNSPFGRQVHWSSLPTWILSASAGCLGWLGNGKPEQLVSVASMFFGPITLLLAAILIFALMRRTFGGPTAVLFIVLLVTNTHVFRLFQAGETDHHGLALVFCLSTLISLINGRVGFVAFQSFNTLTPSTSARGKMAQITEAIFWFRLSGFFAGAALWISAATSIPVVASAGFGGILAACFLRSNRVSGRFDSSLWVQWGLAGTLSSLLFFLLEYFPSNLSLRMEVNGPIFALALGGAGLILAAATRFVQGQRLTGSKPREVALLGLALILVAIPPVIMICFPERFFWIADPFLLALHQEYIMEFQSLFEIMGQRPARWADALPYLAPLLAFPGAVLAWFTNRLSPLGKASLVLLLAPALMLQLLAIYQVRWGHISMGIWLLFALVLAIDVRLGRTADNPNRSKRVSFLGWGLVAAQLAFLMLPSSLSQIHSYLTCLDAPLKEDVGNELILRDVAHRLIQSSPQAVPVVLAGPNSSTCLAYYARIRTLGTLYWENMSGLKTAAQIFAEIDEVRVKKLLEAAGVTHIVIPSWESFGDAYAGLYAHIDPQVDPSRGSPFFRAVCENTLEPMWLRPFAYPIPQGSGVDSRSVRIFAVIPEQTSFEHHFYRGLFYSESQQWDRAIQHLSEALVLQPNHREATVLRAAAVSAQGASKPDKSRESTSNAQETSLP